MFLKYVERSDDDPFTRTARQTWCAIDQGLAEMRHRWPGLCRDYRVEIALPLPRWQSLVDKDAIEAMPGKFGANAIDRIGHQFVLVEQRPLTLTPRVYGVPIRGDEEDAIVFRVQGQLMQIPFAHVQAEIIDIQHSFNALLDSGPSTVLSNVQFAARMRARRGVR